MIRIGVITDDRERSLSSHCCPLTKKKGNDGISWKNYPSEAYSLPQGRKTRIKYTKDGKLWVAGYFNGKLILKYWQNNQWNEFSIPLFEEHHHSYFTFDIFYNDDNFKISLGNSVVYEYDSSKKKWVDISLLNPNPLTKRFNFQLKYDHKGVLWACTGDGLKMRENNEWVTTQNTINKKVYQIDFSQKSNIPFIVADS